MIPVKLTLSNFTSYGAAPQELDFTRFQISAISGQNGAGKSSLLDAITWCIWGSSRLGDNSDQLIRLGQNELWVQFSFELDGHIFTIKRRRNKKSGGSTSLEFFSGSASSPQAHNLTEGTIKATQTKIIDTLHLTYETFTNSAFLRQGHADEFTTKGATDRKRILADILGLSHYDALEEKAKEKVREIQSRLQLLEYQLLEIEAELSQKEDFQNKQKEAEEKVNKYSAEIAGFEEKLKSLRAEKETLSIVTEQRLKLIQSYQESQKELEEILQQGKRRKERIEALKTQLKQMAEVEAQLTQLGKIQKEKEGLDELKNNKLRLEKQLAEVIRERDLKKQKQEAFDKEAADLKSKLETLAQEGAKCPTCGQEVGAEHKKLVKAKLEEQLSQIQAELGKIDLEPQQKLLQELNRQLSGLSLDEEKYQKVQQRLVQLQTLQKQKEELIGKRAALEAEEKVVLELRTLFQNKKTQVDRMKKEVDKLPDVTDKTVAVNLEISQKESELSSLRGQEKEAQNLLGQITTLISKAAQLEKHLSQKKENKVKLQKEKEAFEELALAFGKKGIQAMIIETAIPEIEEEANFLLEKLTEGRMKVYLQTQRETKTKLTGGEKGVIETLDIIISDEMGERPYESFSGGEAYRVNFALRLALSKLLTNRAGSKLQFLVIDEGFGTQDSQGLSRIIEAIHTIKDDFAKILVITHLDELKEQFPTRIEVQKGPSGSTFEVVGV